MTGLPGSVTHTPSTRRPVVRGAARMRAASSRTDRASPTSTAGWRQRPRSRAAARRRRSRCRPLTVAASMVGTATKSTPRENSSLNANEANATTATRVPAACTTARYSSLPPPMNRGAYAPCRVRRSSHRTTINTDVARVASGEPHKEGSSPSTTSRAHSPATTPRSAAVVSAMMARRRWRRCQDLSAWRTRACPWTERSTCARVRGRARARETTSRLLLIDMNPCCRICSTFVGPTRGIRQSERSRTHPCTSRKPRFSQQK